MTTPIDIMSSSASGSVAGYVSVLPRYPVRSCVYNLLVSVIYMTFMLSSHKYIYIYIYIYDVTNLLIIAIFWIKLLLKMFNSLTIQKHDRQFLVVGFAGLLKPNVFESTHYKRWRQRCII
jgi:hypothetical protein